MARDWIKKTAKEYHDWLKPMFWHELVTFTAKPYQRDLQPGIQWWNHRLDAFEAKLAQTNVKFFGVTEKSGEGRIHLHAVATGDVVALESWWRGNDYGIVDRKSMHTPLNGLAYVLKNVHRADARIIGKLKGGVQDYDLLGAARADRVASEPDDVRKDVDTGDAWRRGVSSRVYAERGSV